MAPPRAVNAARFPLRLQEARKRAGLTMEEAAAEAGLASKQAWQAYEAGRVVPRIDQCEQFAAALRVEPEWLAGWK